FFLKSNSERGVDLTEFTGRGKNECSPDVRMTRKRYLCRRSEDSNLTRVPGFCRKDERTFGEVELACDLLHLTIGKAVRFGEHGQLISAEARLSKYVTDVVSIFHESWG